MKENEMFKDMSDRELDQAIRLLQNHAYITSELRVRGTMAKTLRDLDIAVAVKRSRIRRGEWNLDGGHTPECEASCHPSCPIGRERMAEANERANRAAAKWAEANRGECRRSPNGKHSLYDGAAGGWVCVWCHYGD